MELTIWIRFKMHFQCSQMFKSHCILHLIEMANNVVIATWYPISGVVVVWKIRCYETRKKNIGKLIDRVMPSPQSSFAVKFSNKCNGYNGSCLSTCQRYCKQHYRYQHFNMHEYFMNRVLGFCFRNFLENSVEIRYANHLNMN